MQLVVRNQQFTSICIKRKVINVTVALTTVDNPFDPIDDFNNWLREDKLRGTSCCEYIARLANYSNDMSDEEREIETERVIDLIVLSDPMGRYKKVTKGD